MRRQLRSYVGPSTGGDRRSMRHVLVLVVAPARSPRHSEARLLDTTSVLRVRVRGPRYGKRVRVCGVDNCEFERPVRVRQVLGRALERGGRRLGWVDGFCAEFRPAC